MDKNHKILLIIPSLQSGGAEKDILQLGKYLSQQRIKTELLICLTNERDFYKIPSTIKSIPRSKKLAGIFSLNPYVFLIGLLNLRKEIRHISPELIISFTSGMNVRLLLATLATDQKIIISERGNPFAHTMRWYWNLLRPYLYRRARKLVMLTTKSVVWARINHLEHKTVAIPNPVPPPDKKLDKSIRDKTILTVGRLVKLKGHHKLIGAFEIFHQKHPEWKLLIVGEGPEHTSLQKLIESKNLQKCVSLEGKTVDVDRYYAQSSLFTLTSEHEGFCNALAEAMAHGLACISFKCEYGPDELIKNNVNGILVPNGDIKTLAEKLCFLASDPEFRSKLGREATRITERYDYETVMRKWIDCIYSSMADHEDEKA